MKRSDWLFLGATLFGMCLILLWLVWRSDRVRDCGSFDISAYKLGNVPARCAGYLVN